MSEVEPEGGVIEVFVGVSPERKEEEPTLEAAIHDAAHQAELRGLSRQKLRVVHIEFTTGNPHITQYKVIASPSP
jgi:hypothetical protein